MNASISMLLARTALGRILIMLQKEIGARRAYHCPTE